MDNLIQKENDAEEKHLLVNIDKHSSTSPLPVSPRILSSISPQTTFKYSCTVNPDIEKDLEINFSNIGAENVSMSRSAMVSSSASIIDIDGDTEAELNEGGDATDLEVTKTHSSKITSISTSLPAQSEESTTNFSFISTDDVDPPQFNSVDLLGTRKAEVESEAATEVNQVAAVSNSESVNGKSTVKTQVNGEQVKFEVELFSSF